MMAASPSRRVAPNSAIITTLQAGKGFAQVNPNESTSSRSNIY